MPSAKLKVEIFKKYGYAMLFDDEKQRASTWAGLTTNPFLPCKEKRGGRKYVYINGTWWLIEPSEWEFVDLHDAEFMPIKTSRKYRRSDLKNEKKINA